jgi:hypothetical protein
MSDHRALAALCAVTSQLNNNVKQANIDTARRLEYDMVVLAAYKRLRRDQIGIFGRIWKVVEDSIREGEHHRDIVYDDFHDMDDRDFPCISDLFDMLTVLNSKGWDVIFKRSYHAEEDMFMCAIHWNVETASAKEDEVCYPRGIDATMARVLKANTEMAAEIVAYPTTLDAAYTCLSFYISRTMFGYHFKLTPLPNIYGGYPSKHTVAFDIQWELVKRLVPDNVRIIHRLGNVIEIQTC